MLDLDVVDVLEQFLDEIDVGEDHASAAISGKANTVKRFSTQGDPVSYSY